MRVYGGVVDGKFTMSRYTHEQLMIPGEIESILSHGLSIYLMTDSNRVIREPTAFELSCEVKCRDDLINMIYCWRGESKEAQGIVNLNNIGDIDISGIRPLLPVNYRGEFDPHNNVPSLSDDTGQEGWQWAIVNMPARKIINLGGEDIRVKTGDYIIHKDGTYVISKSNCLSPSDRTRLDRMMTDLPKPVILHPASIVYMRRGSATYLQLLLEGYNQPTYEVVDIESLMEVELTPTGDEIWVNSERLDDGVFTIHVYATSKMGPDVEFIIEVFVY